MSLIVEKYQGQVGYALDFVQSKADLDVNHTVCTFFNLMDSKHKSKALN